MPQNVTLLFIPMVTVARTPALSTPGPQIVAMLFCDVASSFGTIAVQALQQFAPNPSTPPTNAQLRQVITPSVISSFLGSNFTFTVNAAPQSQTLAPGVKLTPFPMLPFLTLTDGSGTVDFGKISPCSQAFLNSLVDPFAPPAGAFSSLAVTPNAPADLSSMPAGILADYFQIVVSHLIRTPNDMVAAANAGALFLLHGLRLPDPNAPSQGDNPLYVLTGQQRNLPDDPSTYSITLAGGQSVTINGDAAGGVFKNLSLSVGLTSLQTGQAGWSPFNRVLGLTQVPPFSILPRSFGVSKPGAWAPVNKQIYPLPTNLRIQLTSNPIPTSASVTDLTVSPAVTNAVWATRINFTLHRVPDTSGAAEFLNQVYEVQGMDPAAQDDLLNLLENLPGGATLTVNLLYAVDSTAKDQGQQSDTVSRNNVWLVKANLSTSIDKAASATDVTASADLLDKPTDFLKLLWESATVQSGGYFLVYTPNGGLPESLFGLTGTAVITALVQFSPGRKALALHNCLICDPVTGDKDLLIKPPVFPLPANQQLPVFTQMAGATLADVTDDVLLPHVIVAAGEIVASATPQTLDAIATGLGTSPQAVAKAHPTASLLPGAKIHLGVINATTPGLLLPGSKLSVSVTVDPTKKLGDFQDSFLLPNLILPAGAQLTSGVPLAAPKSIPDIAAGLSTATSFPTPQDIARENPTQALASAGNPVVYTILADDTLLSLSLILNQSIDALVDLCNAQNLFPAGTQLQIDEGWVVRRPVLRPGSLGFRMAANPPSTALEQLYGFLGVKLQDTSAFNGGQEGFPAGPQVDTRKSSLSNLYQQVLWTASFATNPITKGDPYAGLSGTATLSFQFQDLFGNRYLPDSDARTLDLPVLYRDSLIGIGRWPGTVATFNFTSGPGLQVTLSLDPHRYLPADGAPLSTVIARASGDLDLYSQIAFQIAQSDVTFSAVNIFGSQGVASSDLKTAAIKFVASVRAYLTTVSTQFKPTMAPAGTLQNLAGAFHTTALAIAQANQSVPLAAGTNLTFPKLYTALQNDTLGAIAQRFGTPSAALAIGNPGVLVQLPSITPGTTLGDLGLDDPLLPLATIDANEPVTGGAAVLVGVLAVRLKQSPQDLAAANQTAKLVSNMAVASAQTANQTVALSSFLAANPLFPTDQIVIAAGQSLLVGGQIYPVDTGETLASVSGLLSQDVTLGAIAAKLSPAATASQIQTLVSALATANPKVNRNPSIAIPASMVKANPTGILGDIDLTVSGAIAFLAAASNLIAIGENVTISGRLYRVKAVGPNVASGTIMDPVGLTALVLSNSSTAIFQSGAMLEIPGHVTLAGPLGTNPVHPTLSGFVQSDLPLQSLIAANQLIDGLLPSPGNIASLLASSPNTDVGSLTLQNPSSVVIPPSQQTITFPFSAPSGTQISPVTASIQIARSSDLIDPLCGDIPNVQSVTTEIKLPLPDFTQQTLQDYAANVFEPLFSAQKLKLAVGPEASISPTTGAARRLYAVPVAPLVSFGQTALPVYFAIKPLLNTGWSGLEQIGAYPNPSPDTTDLSKLGPATAQRFRSIDLDVWARDFVQTLDLFLSPAYAESLHANALQATYQIAVAAKALLAQSMRNDVDALLASAQSTALELTAAQDALFERVLVQLSEFYKIDAIIQLPVTTQSLTSTSRISGKLLTPAASNANPKYTLSDATIDLNGGSSELTFALQAGGAAGEIDLPLTFQVNALETNIATPLASAPGYESYDWLTLLQPLSIQLPSLSVPLPLRAYPVPPTLQTQSVALISPPTPTDLSTFVNYTFTFNFDYTPASVDLFQAGLTQNVSLPIPSASSNGDAADTGLPAALAQFSTIASDLKQDLAGLTAATPSQTSLTAAQVFASLATTIANQWGNRPAFATASADILLQLPQLKVTKNFNLIQTQNVLASLHVSRNAQLAGQTANPKFIYQVPTVTFPNPVVPLFRVDTPVDLSALVPGGSLAATLTALFTGLFGSLTPHIRIAAYFQFSLNGTLTTSTPVKLLPKQTYDPALCTTLATSLATWKTNQGAGAGSWVFDVSIYSTVQGTADSAPPLLEITRVVVPA